MVAPLAPEDPPRLGEFELLGRLGDGGQGIVYLARDPVGQRVAVKVLLRTDAEARARLARELAAVESVAPFCTARVLTAVPDGPRPYVVSEFVDGPTLAERVHERGPLHGGELDRLAVGTTTALAAIHAAGVVHRDFKPNNVLLGPDGPRVVDFGIARADGVTTMTSGLIGTPAYLAPEQLGGAPASPASDVFAWASTMVFAATGVSPFAGAGLAEVLNRIVTHEPDLSAVPPPLRDLVAAALEKDPSHRPTAGELLSRLIDPVSGGRDRSIAELTSLGSRLAAEPDTTAPPSSRAPGPVGWTAGRGRRTALVVAALVAVAVGALTWLRPFGGTGSQASSGTGEPGSPSSSPSSSPSGSGEVSPSGVPDGGPQVSDRFGRTVSTGFGTTDERRHWSVGVPASGYSVDGEKGRITMLPGASSAAYLDGVKETGTDLGFTFASDKPPTNGGIYVSAVGRRVPTVGSYRAHVSLRPTGKVLFQLIRTEAGRGEIDLAQPLGVTELTAAVGVAMRVRVQVTGTSPTTIRGKVWAVGAAEPDWLLSVTDTTPGLQVPGGAGIATFLSRKTTEAPVTVTVDDFALTATPG
ncbi:serine/threonine-protein kinase [Streptosporangium saharense]|uniref:non-specific serine/threonine protein kinase n=1 Tax=Streptosporangium saharense TaxID=1706840 RepID=A0A7W7VM84_9ACTN|nr:serine/threonine-protein kinase [Streptosporangium saharense]MBB4914985.1 serine/threonine protein kinase [Streptosporangium saharense]